MRPKPTRRKTRKGPIFHEIAGPEICASLIPRKSGTPKPHRTNVEGINSASRGTLNENPRFDTPKDKKAARGEISRPGRRPQT